MALHARIPYSLVTFAAGLATAFIPGIPRIAVDPQIVLSLMLPPMLYVAAVTTSTALIRHTLRAGIGLGLLLVPATVGAVAVAARLLIADLSWVSATLLGIAAAVSETRLLRETGRVSRLPRALADTLRGQELVAPIMIVSILLLAVDAASAGSVSALDALRRFGGDFAGGGLLGVGLGLAIGWLRRRARVASVDIALAVATPYLASLVSEALGLSVVVAILVAGIVIAARFVDPRSGEVASSPQSRLIARVVWDETGLVVSGVVYFLAGHLVPETLGGLTAWSPWRLFGVALVLLLVVLAVQFAFALAAARLPPIAALLRGQHRPGAWFAAAAVMTWPPTRSVIGLMIALSIPVSLEDGRPFPDRGLILVLAALLVVGSVLVQGPLLVWVLRRSPFGDEEEEAREEALAREAMAGAATGPGDGVFGRQRLVLLGLRRHNRIGDPVLQRLLEEVDLKATARAGELTERAGV